MPGLSKTTTPSAKQSISSELNAVQDDGSLWRAEVVFLTLLLMMVATGIAYSPVFFNFFAGDDFVHLTWLTQAVQNPELIWRNFHSSWLDGTSTHFYRPLISVFMVSDYLLWGLNGLGFRITNLLCHLLSAIFLYLIMSKIENHCRINSSSARKPSWWALSTAALFALYPLHPEAVSWITGRVDTIVTTFILSSFWCFTRWRESQAKGSKAAWRWLIASGVGMILALTSKEMAITLPALFFAYEFLLGTSDSTGTQVAPGGIPFSGARSFEDSPDRLTAPIIIQKITHRSVAAFKATMFFWILLAAYFGVRRWALGTFVGGYDDSLFFIANWRSFVSSWLHGLRMFVVPINKELLGSHHILTKAWEVLIVTSVLLGVIAVSVQRKSWAPVAFVICWLGLSLLPVYKIFTISADLQGSRLAYLATVPLCALLTVGLINSGRQPWQKYLPRLNTLALILCAGILLWINNQAWAHAGRESNAIRANLSSLYQKLPGDPQVLLLGLPDQIEGAYVSRNALWGMLKKPQLQRDISNCLMMNSFEPILPFGFLRQSIQESANQVKIFNWQSAQQQFQELSLPESKAAFETKVWSAATLPSILVPEHAYQVNAGASHLGAPTQDSSVAKLPRNDNTTAIWTPTGLEIKGGSGSRGRPALLLNLDKLPCWAIQFIEVKIKLLGPGSAGSRVGADLLYANDLDPNFTLAKRTHCDLVGDQQEQSLVFSLHSLPDWALGGRSHGFKLLLPENCHVVIESVSIVDPQSLMPSVSFSNSGWLGTKGFVHLSPSTPAQEISFKSDSVAGASSTAIEITRANLFFENQNTSQPSSVRLHLLKQNSSSGTLLLKRDMFPSAGIYELRPWSLNSRGETTGVSGDHIVISVDS